MGLAIIDTFWQDVRYAARHLRHSPGFAITALLTLALCIGATTAIFSVIDGVLLRPFDYPDADRLYAIHERIPSLSYISPRIPVNAMHFERWRQSARSFEGLALLQPVTYNLSGAGEPERVPAARVSPSLFEMLGVRARLGRTFTEEEDQLGRDRVVVLTDDLWARRFASDARVIGQTIRLDGEPYTIVGVLPPGFTLPKLTYLWGMPSMPGERPELLKPFAATVRERRAFGDFNFVCLGKLRPGVSMAQATSELDTIQADLARQQAEIVELGAVVVPLQEQVSGRSRTALQLLSAAVTIVLFIGCVNISSLLLAREAQRRREIAIRRAAGASQLRLMRQMLTESLLLSGTGGLMGVAIAAGLLRLILVFAPVDVPRLDEVTLDTRVLLFTLLISAGTGLLVGVLPAWRFANTTPLDIMKRVSSTVTPGRADYRLRALLVSFEVGLGTICLVAGGLLAYSFVNLLNVDRGFEAQDVVTVSLSLPQSRYSDSEKAARFVDLLLEGVRALPGISAAGTINWLPLAKGVENRAMALERTALPPAERSVASVRVVDPDYFTVMRIPLQAGRFFDESDRDRRSVALVSSGTAGRLWPGERGIGKRFRFGPDDAPLIEVVGIVRDVQNVSLSEPPGITVYIPSWQSRFFETSLVVRTRTDPLQVAAAIGTVIHRIDPELAIPAFRRMDDIVSASVAERRFQMNLILLLAVAALLLASLGVYGLVSHSVAQRVPEIGLRMALGAHANSILRLVLQQALWPVLLGLVVGIGCSVAFARILRSLSFGVSPTNAAIFIVAVSVIVAAALLASYIPARRATHVDPAVALRSE